MGKGGNASEQVVTWAEVRTHCKREDKWLVINGQVYDITDWSRRHPGGSRVISHFAGQDASEAFTAFHSDIHHVQKYLKAIHIGRLGSQMESDEDRSIKEDFVKLRETAEKMGLFTPSTFFYTLTIVHILALEFMSYFLLYYFGTSWLPWIASILCAVTYQVQAGWTQHDFGHLSVFKTSRANHLMHLFMMNFTKGASSHWWNHMHYQHHAKPNVLGKDPDVRLEALFVLGEEMPKKIAKEKKSSMPYNWQHCYWFFTLPPLLFPVYFQIMTFRHPIIRRQWLDLACVVAGYIKYMLMLVPVLGFWGFLGYIFMSRVLESHWFTWVTQSNHIPMEIAEDKARPWLSLQLSATCNVERSAFNDWFTGHLNFQVEHHLFPRMPRHNLYKIAHLSRSLCEKHGVHYQVKPLWKAFYDIYSSLKTSGQLWEHYYDAYHLS